MNASNKQMVALVKAVVLIGAVVVTGAIEVLIVPGSGVEQAQALAGTPNPRVDSIQINGSYQGSLSTSGDSVLIEVKATNAGTTAGYRGGIYVSFPEFDSDSDADYVDLVSLRTSRGDADLEYFENRPGDPNDLIWYTCGSGYYGVARDLRVAGYAPSVWEPGEVIYLQIKVTLPAPGIYSVNVRVTAAGTPNEGPYYYDPATGSYRDQQCVRTYHRTMGSGLQPVYLPVILKDYVRSEASRQVWMQISGCSSPSRCDERLVCLQAAGVTRIYYSVYYQTAYYPSRLLPHRSFDSLAYLVPRAHARGMEVYAAMASGHMGWPEHPEWNARLNHPNVTQDWLDFSLPEARDFLADVAEEIVRNYEVDGIMLDYTRWREEWYRAAHLSAGDISLTVQGIYNRIKAVRPVALAASPAGDHRYAAYWLGQRWYDWLDGGYIDLVTPMAYHDDTWIRNRIAEWRMSGHFPGRISPLLSAAWFSWNPGHTQEEPKTTAEVVHQIDLCYDEGSAGVALWDYRYLCGNRDLVRVLGSGGW